MKILKSLFLILLATFAFAAENKSKTDAGSMTSTTFITFTKLDFAALDIGCGSEGDVCAVGVNKRLYCYDFVQDIWNLIPNNDEISDIIAVDVDDDGKIYIIAQCGIYYLDCFDKWIRLPGSGKDIGVGVNFDVWKIGTDKESATSNNYGVWKLFCECDCNCICSRICLRFRKLSLNICEPVVRRRCYWFRAEVYGVAIDVNPNGDAAVVRADGKVFIVNGLTFESSELIATNPKIAVDVTFGNTGLLFITTASGEIYKFDVATKTWIKVTQATVPGSRICGTAFDHIFYTAKDSDINKQYVYTSARFEFI